MRRFSPNWVFLAAVLVRYAFAQTPVLQMNVIYVCTDGQSFKVFSCDNTTGACDFQNYKKGVAFQRGQALRAQLAALLPEKCHAQTPAEAQAEPHRGEIPPAPSPFQARANASNNASRPAAAVNSQTGPGSGGFTGPGVGGFKVGDTVRVLSDGWQEAQVVQVHGSSYLVRMANGIEVSKFWPMEVRRLGTLTAQDHAMGQYDVHDRVQVLVNGRWTEGEVRGQNLNMYDVRVKGVDTGFGSDIVNTTAENIRMSTTAAPPPPAQRAAGQAPKPGLTSCAGKYEGRWEHVTGMGGMTVIFRSGTATVSGGLGGDDVFDCFTGDGKIVLYKAGSFTPYPYPFNVNNDGTLQTPLGAIKKMGN